MMWAILRYLLAGLWPPPPLPRLLGATLALLALTSLNLALADELWPHTPALKNALPRLLGLLTLVLWPQLLAWSWRWLRAYAGPALLRVLATAAFLAGAALSLVAWTWGLLLGIGRLLG